MSLNASRAVMRRSHYSVSRIGVRNASTTSEAANAVSSGATKAKDSAQQVTSKASEGLSRVTSSAGSSLSRISSATTSAIGRIGGRTGRVVNYVQSLIPPTVYYSKVGWELAKLVFQGQKMSPPSMSTFQSYLQPMIRAIRHPGSMFTQSAESSAANPASVLSRIRGVNRAQLVGAGIVTAEVIGFFSVGEMLGRMKIVGYRHATDAPEHH